MHHSMEINNQASDRVAMRIRLPRAEMIGKTYGQLTVVGLDVDPRKILAVCACGKEKAILRGSIRSGKSTSCGCGVVNAVKERGRIATEIRMQKESQPGYIPKISKPRSKKIASLIGKKFGRITFTGDSGDPKHLDAVCDCGKVIKARFSDVSRGRTVSCGCFALEWSRRPKMFLKTHGKSHQPTWRSWMSMKGRCHAPNKADSKNYKERGILVCDRWLGSKGFENFYSDMGDRPIGMTIDRINNDLGYSPDNCKWSTVGEQMSNRRNTMRLVIDGESKTALEWSNLTGVSYHLIRSRVYSGWDHKRAVFDPVQESKRHVNPSRKPQGISS